MRRNWLTVAACAMLAATTAGPSAAQQVRTRGETGLVGIKLFDSGMRLLQVYGNPDQIIPAGGGAGAVGPSGGGGGGGSRGPISPGRGAGGGSMEGLIDYNSPFQFGDDMLREQTKGLNQIDETDSGGMSVGGGAGSGRGRQLGPPGVPNAPGGGGPSGPAQFIRWVYNRGGSRYGFILDNNNRVVQIEAIGMQNNKVRTRRGIGFGATFKDVMSKYQAPEGYQINGDAIIMRYLVRDKVAFRLNRLGLDKPHVVTAIVVAAGKT